MSRKVLLIYIIIVLFLSVSGSLILYHDNPNKTICNSTSSELINYTINHSDSYKPSNPYPPVKPR